MIELGTLVKTPKGLGRIAGKKDRCYIVDHHEHIVLRGVNHKTVSKAIPVVHLYLVEDVKEMESWK